jgi:hypothetical protein
MARLIIRRRQVNRGLLQCFPTRIAQNSFFFLIHMGSPFSPMQKYTFILNKPVIDSPLLSKFCHRNRRFFISQILFLKNMRNFLSGDVDVI